MKLIREQRIAKTIRLEDCEDAITRILYINYKSRIALNFKNIKISLFDKFLAFELWLKSIFDKVVNIKFVFLFEFVAKKAF